MPRLYKIPIFILAVIAISGFFIALQIIFFWLFANNYPNLIYAILIFMAVCVFTSGMLAVGRIRRLQKEIASQKSFLEKSESKIAELDKNRLQLYDVFMAHPEGLMAIDAKGKILFANPKAKKLLNASSWDLAGMDISQASGLSGLRNILPVISYRGNLKKEIEIAGRTIECSSAPIFSGSENLIVLKDKTSYKEEQENKINEMLSIAHSLRTGASSLKWSLKMFLDGDFGKAGKEQKEVMQKLYLKNEDFISEIDRLIGSVKENSPAAYKKILVNLESLVSGIISSFSDKIKGKDIKIDFKNQKDTPQVFADPEKMHVVVENLLDNALKYTPQGGKINISLAEKSGNVRFSIQDTGIGIPPEDQPEIFSKFFRAGNTPGGEGSGVGLFISKKIIEDHGGSMWFSSEPGKGTSFFFDIPVKSAMINKKV